ncbi:MAG: type I CRISPR-associated protein Cas7, partial [bacterium]|nr:type I CRISPR-associated protein Cas7 [bacterium]
MNALLKKSELLFLYESTYSMPNGDPFTGEQRYDEETKKALVSDVRIKRFIRDFLINQGKEVYVWNDQSNMTANESGAAARVKSLKEKYKEESELFKKDKNGKPTKDFDTKR